MNIIISLVILAGGLLMTIFPQGWFELTERWKSYAASEPSERYIRMTRIWGILCILAAIAYFVILVIEPEPMPIPSDVQIIT